MQQLSIKIPPEQAKAIETFRFCSRSKTKSDAVKFLIVEGLRALTSSANEHIRKAATEALAEWETPEPPT